MKVDGVETVLRCSFCNKDQNEVRKLIAGRQSLSAMSVSTSAKKSSLVGTTSHQRRTRSSRLHGCIGDAR